VAGRALACQIRREVLTTKKGYAAVDATHRLAATTSIGMAVNLTFLEHLSATITRKEHHRSKQAFDWRVAATACNLNKILMVVACRENATKTIRVFFGGQKMGF
jgi:hypothetical protein